LVVVRTSVSQLLPTSPSQSASPVFSVSQLSTKQFPVTHVGVPGGATVQSSPQFLQLSNVRRSVSQPSSGLLLQSPQPPSQDSMAHTPVLHVALAWGSEQGVPQSPQLPKSRSGVSHPVVGSLSQFPHPASQLETKHSPLLQPSMAWSRAAHGVQSVSVQP
jgi:hypothetical protein